MTEAAAPPTTDADRLYFRQLLAGRDFAVDDQVARQMVNFVYLVGDRITGEAVIVDPAYGVDELLGLVAGRRDDLRRGPGHPLPPRPRRRRHDGVGHRGDHPAARGRLRCPSTCRPTRPRGWCGPPGWASGSWPPTTAATWSRWARSPSPWSTPRATRPGSQCFLVDGRLIAGDTLFLDGCGRTDLPGGDPEAMYESLTTRLAQVPDDTVLYPGHLYSPEPSATMGDTRAHNYVFRLRTPEQWMTMFGS